MPAAALLRRASLPALACALAIACPAAAQTTGSSAGSFAGPAGAAPAAPARNPDPYERWNRKSYAFSQAVDARFIRPGALLWKRYVPAGVREGLRNALSNLGEPVVFFNDVLQARADDASVSLKRFIVNSTVGAAGLADVAKAHGLPHHDNGFGITLGRYGAGPGPYIYVPVLGPNDGRDLFGSGVDTLLNPRTWIGYGARTATGVADTVVGGINLRADADNDLQTLKATSTDEYATLRSLFLQNRQAQVRGGAVDINALPDFDDPTAQTAPAAPGSVSPTGSAPLKRPGPNAPSGDASALPQAAPTPTDGPAATPSGPGGDAAEPA